MANYILKEISKKGYGVFAAQDIRQSEHIFHFEADFVTASSLRQDNILQAHLAADANR